MGQARKAPAAEVMIDGNCEPEAENALRPQEQRNEFSARNLAP